MRRTSSIFGVSQYNIFISRSRIHIDLEKEIVKGKEEIKRMGVGSNCQTNPDDLDWNSSGDEDNGIKVFTIIIV
jgi:hypothetical protein